MVQKISNIEVVINIFENFCRYNDIDELEQKKKWSNILPSKDMCIFFTSTTIEHRNLINLKLF